MECLVLDCGLNARRFCGECTVFIYSGFVLINPPTTSSAQRDEGDDAEQANFEKNDSQTLIFFL